MSTTSVSSKEKNKSANEAFLKILSSEYITVRGFDIAKILLTIERSTVLHYGTSSLIGKLIANEITSEEIDGHIRKIDNALEAIKDVTISISQFAKFKDE